MLSGGKRETASQSTDVLAADSGSLCACDGRKREVGIVSGTDDTAHILRTSDLGKSDTFPRDEQSGACLHLSDQASNMLTESGDGGNDAEAGNAEHSCLIQNIAQKAASQNLHRGAVGQLQRDIAPGRQRSKQGRQINGGAVLCFGLHQCDLPSVSAFVVDNVSGQQTALHGFRGMAFQGYLNQFRIVGQSGEQRFFQ